MGPAKAAHLGLGSGYTSANEGPLATIMGFLPLKQAFGEYCQKALCGEVCQNIQ